jgi:hypothetical protein
MIRKRKEMRDARRALRTRWLTPTKSLSNQIHSKVTDAYKFLSSDVSKFRKEIFVHIKEKNLDVDEKKLKFTTRNLKGAVRDLIYLFDEAREDVKDIMVNNAVLIKRLIKRLYEVNESLTDISNFLNKNEAVKKVHVNLSDLANSFKEYPNLIYKLENFLNVQRKMARFQRRKGHQKFKDTTTFHAETVAQPKIRIYNSATQLKRLYRAETDKEKKINSALKKFKDYLNVNDDVKINERSLQKLIDDVNQSLKDEIKIVKETLAQVATLFQYTRTMYQDIVDEFDFFDELLTNLSNMQDSPPTYFLRELKTEIDNFDNSVNEDTLFNEFVFRWLMLRADKKLDISKKDVNIDKELLRAA